MGKAVCGWYAVGTFVSSFLDEETDVNFDDDDDN